MAKKDPIDWITINGNHVPIFEGETKEQAAQRFIAEKQSVKVGDGEVEVVQRKKRVNQEDLTDERIISEIAGEDSYANTENYRYLLENTTEAWNKKWEIQDKIKELKKELEAESSPKPEEEWDTDDEIVALLGDKPSTYTERGKEIEAELSRLRSQKDIQQEEWENWSRDLRNEDRAHRQIEREQFLKEQGVDDISTDLKDDYFGFSKSETTTPYIDEMLKDGSAFVVEMTPKRYLQECAYNIFEGDDTTLATTLRGTSSRDIAKYMTMMEEGVKFNTPYLNFRDKEQEGRHRAIAAYMLGIDKIPVVIVRRR